VTGTTPKEGWRKKGLPGGGGGVGDGGYWPRRAAGTTG